MSSTTKQADLWTILRMPRFRNVWIGASISQLGDVCFLIAVPWLVLQMTGSGLVLGSLAMAVAIPRSILLLLGGSVSDRLPPSLILIVGNLVQAVSVAIVAIKICTGIRSPVNCHRNQATDASRTL